MVNNRDFFVIVVRPMLGEFFGQLLFAFLHSSSANTIGTAPGAIGNPLLPALSDGLTLAVLVMVFGHISGAHVNFAVTTGIFVAGKIKWFMVPLYLVAQVLGSLTGAVLAYVANGNASGAFQLGPGVGVGQGVLMETILSALLILAVLVAAVELSSTNAAFAIGFTIATDIMAGFAISGGCMNPTLSLGPAVVSGQWTNYWVYWVGPLLGAVIAASLFRLILRQNHSRVICKYGRNILDDREDSIKEAAMSMGMTSSSTEL